MEPFGHAFSGICLAQALRPTPPGISTPPRGWWPAVGAFAALFPDIDAVSYLGGADTFQRYHQYYTHNLIAFAFAPAMLTFLIRRLTPNPPTFARTLALLQGGMALHLLGDTIAHWPLKLFWPFSREGLCFELIPRDFSIGLALLLLFGAVLSFLDSVERSRRAIAIATLFAGTLYVLIGPGW